ncbi:hypothetical protein BH24ACT6_BH24ACT6_10300 [soil metagenome]
MRRRSRHRGRRRREAWCRGRLGYAVDLDECLAGDVVGVHGGLCHLQHGGEADVAALHQIAPLLTGLRGEHLAETFLQRRPSLGVHLRCELLVVGESGARQQLGVELRLDRPDRHVVAVGAAVHVVEVGAGVEHVLPTPVLVEHPDLAQRPEHRHQQRRAVDHRGVDHLALPPLGGIEKAGDDAEREQHASPTEVADHVHRRDGRFAAPAEVGERAAERDVVDVVSCGAGVRPDLSPARHPPEDEARVAGETDVGSDTEPFHHAGAEALDQRVSTVDEREQRLHTAGRLEVDGDAATAPRRDVGVRPVGARRANLVGTVDPHHLGAEVGEHHRCERSGADAGDLDDAVAVERTRHVR